MASLSIAGVQANSQNASFGTENEVWQRTGADVIWQKDESTRQKAEAIVHSLLRKPLTVSSAVQIALLNNRKLQATFEEVGIAKAEMLEALTVPNPSIEFDVQFPFTPDTLNRYAWLVAQDFVQLLMRPLKKRISDEMLESAQFRVANEVLDLVTEVKSDYFSLQAGQQILGRMEIIQETHAASLELAQKQFKAGNTPELALLQMQSIYSEGRLEIQNERSKIDEQREHLNKLLGLWGSDTDWQIQGDLPIPRKETFSNGYLESLAISQRLDLKASHRKLNALVTELGLTNTFRWVPVLDFGFSGERDIDGALNMGPQFRIELPVFNQGQARLEKGRSLLRRASAEFENLAVEIRSDTRRLSHKLSDLGERAAFYRDTLIPERTQIVKQSLLQYNAMQIGSYELFNAKAEELRAEQASIETLREYWITRAELEKTVGGSLNPHSKSEKKSTVSTQP